MRKGADQGQEEIICRSGIADIRTPFHINPFGLEVDLSPVGRLLAKLLALVQVDPFLVVAGYSLASCQPTTHAILLKTGEQKTQVKIFLFPVCKVNGHKGHKLNIWTPGNSERDVKMVEGRSNVGLELGSYIGGVGC